MADLQSCFFCGTPEELKQYAVVPPRFTDDGDPQTAVLCPQCKTKLLQVIEPLVDRLEGEGSEPVPTEQSTSQQSATPSGDSVTMTPPGGSESAGNDPEPADTGESEPNTSNEAESSTADAASEATADGPAAPPSYRRAMRMLETREFPLERREVESLLANAYDLERHELEAVLSHAIETGELVEEEGQFRQPK